MRVIQNGDYADFKSYAMGHMGISGMRWHQMEQMQEALYSRPMVGGYAGMSDSNSLTPMILEERTLNVTQMSVFDKMAADRILFITGVVNERMSLYTQAQLNWLDSRETKDIQFNISSPGGSVLSGLEMYDTMNYINSEIATICTGLAASMGSILLGAGKKGKRLILPNARVMIHQVSSGCQGVLDDMEISMAETKKYNTKLFGLLGEFTGKDPKQIRKDAKRDLWLDAKEALDYGIVDGIITKKGGEIIRRAE